MMAWHWRAWVLRQHPVVMRLHLLSEKEGRAGHAKQHPGCGGDKDNQRREQEHAHIASGANPRQLKLISGVEIKCDSRETQEPVQRPKITIIA